MKAQFDLKIFLGSKREQIIAKYEQLTKEVFFDGTDLRTFGIRVYNAMERNNIKSEKTASAKFAFLLSDVYMARQLKGGDQHDAELAYAKKFPHLNK